MLLHRGRSKDEPRSKSLGPTFMTSQQVGQQPFASDVLRSSSPLKFFSSSAVSQPSKPVDSQKAWTADFLTDLRSNRPARPSGSRPLPARHAKTMPIPTLEPPIRPLSAMSKSLFTAQQTESTVSHLQEASASAVSPRWAESAMSMREYTGRPLAQQPVVGVATRDFTASTLSPDPQSKVAPETTPKIKYIERGQRWMEKQEAKSLKEALEDMDLREEQRVHAAAQDEATDLVWKHRNSGAPYKNPHQPRDYKQHLRRGSYAQSQSVGQNGVLPVGKRKEDHGKRSVSNGSSSTKSNSEPSGGSRISSGSSNGHAQAKTNASEEAVTNSVVDRNAAKNKTYKNLTFPLPPTKVFKHRRSSGSRSRHVSGEARQSLFKNPEDQIYEEPEEAAAITAQTEAISDKPLPLKPKTRNSSRTFNDTKKVFDRPASTTVIADTKFSKYDIHNNPPSQSLNPSYLRNSLPATVDSSIRNTDSEVRVDTPQMKNGIEIRSAEIRAATSMRLKDRSPKLPSPTFVSDRPGRPIISFDRDYKPRQVELKQEHTSTNTFTSRDEVNKTLPSLPSKPQMPPSTASAPAIPTINILDSARVQGDNQPTVPTIEIESIPEISVSDFSIPLIAASESPAPRPLPRAASNVRTTQGQRPLPHHSSTAPVPSNKSHWTPALSRATAQCAACALPISGRIVSAASQRFHPACFNCFQCGELLECVAFYPEPETSRNARLARIQARLNHEQLSPEDACHTEQDDGDDGLRFYCHLDFHENFSPRCRSCKTPIEGEVVVACGGEWHVGHFFCAECGDPFDANTPFVEKDGFAWCVDCHSRRFSGKCAGCRKPIINMVVKALGREWHDVCFCCKVCITHVHLYSEDLFH